MPARVRGHASVLGALTGPSPARGQAQVPPAPAGPAPVRGHAQVPQVPAASPSAPPPPEPPGIPTALRGVAAAPPPAPPPPAPPPPAGSPPAGSPPATPAADPDPPEPPRRPEPDHAVRAYGASLFTAESRDRERMHRLLAAARTPQWSPQVVSVLAGRPGLGASTTAAGVARTLATVRDDHTALLGGAARPADDLTIAEVSREHAFTLVDLGAHRGEETPRALAVSTRVLVVTAADRRATAATQLLLERIHQVHPPLAAATVVAVVCRSARQYRQLSRGLSEDLSAPAAQIVPVPYDPAVPRAEHLDLTRLRTLTREAYLRLAVAVALPQPAPGAQPPAGYRPAHPGGV